MRVISVEIKNYRNLDELIVFLHPEINFLVGENDLGKSNFLDLLDTIFNHRSFVREDFINESNPIEVIISISLSELELGIFEDYFDSSNTKQVNFIIKQDTPEDQFIVFWKDNYEIDPTEVNYALFNQLSFIKYDSMRTPREELNFDRDRGVGKFLSYLIRETIKEDSISQDLLKDEIINPIIGRINNTLEKITPVREMGIGTFADQDQHADLLGRILLLKNRDEFDIQKSGQGIQFYILLVLSILERLISLKNTRKWNNNVIISRLPSMSKSHLETFLKQECITWDEIQQLLIPIDDKEDGYTINFQNLTEDSVTELKLERFFCRKSTNVVLGLDEPEIHLHPYMQRSLVKYIYRILNNQDNGFREIIHDILDIDDLSGQAIIVSHSPNILLDDYKHIVHFFKKSGEVKSISGCGLNFDNQLTKHLLANFYDIKEAFFSKCVIVVEGRSEIGAMSIWKDKYLKNSDDLGISIISADSCTSVKPIVRLLNEFCIPNVSILDADDNNRTEFADISNVFFTNGRDFEEDIYEEVLLHQPGCDALFDILDYFDSGLSAYQKNTFLISKADKYGIRKTWDLSVPQFFFSDEVVKNDQNLCKVMFINFLGLNKTITLGRYMATKIPWIPQAYRKVMDEARRKATEMV